jgi:hypothetical protein
MAATAASTTSGSSGQGSAMAALSGMMTSANSFSMLNMGLSTWKPPSPPIAIFSGLLAESASSSADGICGASGEARQGAVIGQ